MLFNSKFFLRFYYCSAVCIIINRIERLPMATAVLNPVFEKFRGRIGNLVLYNRMGVQCMRVYVKPHNPDTELQKKCRSTFADAVSSWKKLSSEEKYFWNRKGRSKRLTGYNYFISMYMKGKISLSYDISRGDLSISKGRIYSVPSSPLRSEHVPAPVMLQNSGYSPSLPRNASSG